MAGGQACAIESELAVLAGTPRAANLVGFIGGAQHPAKLRGIAKLREHAATGRYRAGKERIHAREHLGILGQQNDLGTRFLGRFQHGVGVRVQRIVVLLAKTRLRIRSAQIRLAALVVGAGDARDHAGILHRHDGALRSLAASHHEGHRRERGRSGIA